MDSALVGIQKDSITEAIVHGRMETVQAPAKEGEGGGTVFRSACDRVSVSENKDSKEGAKAEGDKDKEENKDGGEREGVL